MTSGTIPRLAVPLPELAAIDRLGWTAGIMIQSFGWRIGVRTNHADLMPLVRSCLPPGWEGSAAPEVDRLYSLHVASAGRPDCCLFTNATLAARGPDVEGLLDVLENDLQLFVAEFARDRIFVHAGVVGWQGQALLLPGRSFAGKTTLVTALLRNGATYYSDEYAVLDERGLVHAYPRRLSVRRSNGGRPWRPTAQELGAAEGSHPVPVKLLAFTTYRPGSTHRLRELQPGQAVLQLLNHTVPAQRFPRRVMDTLPQVAARAGTLLGVRGEADEAAAALLGAMKKLAHCA